MTGAAPSVVRAPESGSAGFCPAAAILVVVVFLTTCWDFYIPALNVRPFDLVALALLGFSVVIDRGGIFVISREAAVRIAILASIVAVYCVAGAIYDSENAKPAIGALLGVMMLAAFVCASGPGLRIVVVALRLSLAIHVCAFAVQIVAYYVWGTVINYHVWLGGEPRVMGPVFRACGLMLEPAHYGVLVFMLTTLRYRMTGRVGSLGFIALISAMVSLSVWGIFASTILFAFFLRKSGVALLGGGVFAGFALLWMLSLPELETFWIVERLTNLGTDASGAARYGGLAQTVLGGIWRGTTWFGHGVGNDYLEFGASGLGYLIHTAGIVGAVTLVVSALFVVPVRDRPFVVMAMVLALTATSLWTCLFWWVWLGIMLLAGVPYVSEAAEHNADDGQTVVHA